jgi:tetratricopeptide (TPR) repeat protein/TolB-like protein
VTDAVDSSDQMLAADTARWQRVKDVFLGALACADEERAPYVELACGTDVELRGAVDRMLAAHAGAGDFLESSPARLTGRRLAHYEVGRRIGAGGMGEVYAARDLDLQRDVALKIGLSRGRDARLRREAQHASRLNHPHICTIYEVGTFEGRCYIAMEYVPGQRLCDIVPGDGLAIDLVVRYGSQVADALAHAHHEGVIHRDLKSANVVVTPEGRAKVLDFGLARLMSGDDRDGSAETPASISGSGLVAGTLAYMSPEQLRGGPVDARSDIWSLGVLLYEMAVGARPFVGATTFETCAAILHESFASMPARVPMPLQSIIARCLQKSPDDRYQYASDVLAAIQAISTTPLLRSPLPLTRRLRLAPRRLAALAAILLLAVVVLVWWQWNGRADSAASVAVSRPAIAVMPFENLGGGDDGAWLSKGVQSMLVTGLAQARGVHLVSMQRLYEVTRETGAAGLDSLSRVQAADVARRAGAGATVVGSVMRSGATIRIDAQVEDLSTGRVLAATSVNGSDVFALTDQLAARIRDSVGVGDGGEVRPVADVSSASLEAYRLYSQGLDAAANLRLEEAWPLLQQAVRIDPTFAEAYLQLALTSGAAGRPVERSGYLRKAAENQQRLSERQRMLMQVELARDQFQFDEAVQRLDRLFAQFPDLDAVSTLAVQLHSPLVGPRPDVARLMAITTGVVQANPSSGLARNNHAYSLMYAGRYQEAVEELQTYARLAPREPNPYDSLGDAYLMMGSAEQAIEAYTHAVNIDARFIRGGRAWAMAVLGRYDEALMESSVPPHLEAVLLSRVGRYGEAATVLRQAVSEADADGDRWRASGLHLVSAMLAIERRDYDAALAAIRSSEQYVARMPPERQRVDRVLIELLRGVTEIRRGRVDAARTHLQSLSQTYRSAVPAERWWHDALAGEIALSSGDLERAAASFATGRPSPKMFISSLPQGSVLVNDLVLRDGAARVARARGDLRAAAERYRQLLSYGPDQIWIAAFEPRFVLERARTLEQLGDRPAARAEYQRFINLWSHADAGLPEVSEAKQAVARLTV